MLFQNDRHRQIFETQQISLRKPDNRTLAVLYLLTADHPLWMKTKLHITDSGKIKLENVRLGDIATDGYALWKAAKELQTGENRFPCANYRIGKPSPTERSVSLHRLPLFPVMARRS